MSIQLTYRRLAPAQFAELRGDEATAAAFFYPEDEEELDGRSFNVYGDAFEEELAEMCLEKFWQVVHFLLTGEVAWDPDGAAAPPPQGAVVMGGELTEWEASYGYIRFLQPEEVQAIAHYLQGVTVAELRARHVPAPGLKIYSFGTAPFADEFWEELPRVFDYLTRFYTLAAEAGEIILISFD